MSFFAEGLHPMFANLYSTPLDPLPTPAWRWPAKVDYWVYRSYSASPYR